jgi:hypothetical protein
MNLGRDAEAWNGDSRYLGPDNDFRSPRFDLSSCGIHPSLALWEIGHIVARAEDERGNARAALLATALGWLRGAARRAWRWRGRPAAPRPETA